MEGVGDRVTERSVVFAVILSIAADTQRKCLPFEATRGKRRQGGKAISGICGRSYLIAEKTPDNGLAILLFDSRVWTRQREDAICYMGGRTSIAEETGSNEESSYPCVRAHTEGRRDAEWRQSVVSAVAF